MSNDTSNAKKKKGKKPEIPEETTFIVLILRPTDPEEDAAADPNLLTVLTGWCVLAAHGLDAAMGHIAKLDFTREVDLRDAVWKNVASGGKMATLKDGKMIQVLPAPLYIVEAEEAESLIAPPYLM